MTRTYIGNKAKQWFHFKHEAYTRMAYFLPWLPPHRYVFVLTNQCNMICNHCYQDRRFDPAKAMDARQWMDLSDAIPAGFRITMTGGEPLLMPSFKMIFEKIAKKHPCNLITNGTLLDEKIVEMMLSLPKFKILAVSIDNLKDGGTNLREYSDRQWNDLNRTLKYFVRRRNELSSRCMLEIKTLILDENANALLKIHRYCVEDLKADHHTFQFLKGSPFQHADKNCTWEQIFEESKAPLYKRFDLIVKELNRIKEYNISRGKISFLHPGIADIHSEKPFGDISLLNVERFDAKNFKACKFPWSSVHINYDGEVFPCLSIPLGNLKTKSLSAALNGKAIRSFRSVIKKNGLIQACNRCGWLKR